MGKRLQPTVEVFQGLSGAQTADAFLDMLRRSPDICVDKDGLSYWRPSPHVEQVWTAWHLRLIAYELELRNGPVETELARRRAI